MLLQRSFHCFTGTAFRFVSRAHVPIRSRVVRAQLLQFFGALDGLVAMWRVREDERHDVVQRYGEGIELQRAIGFRDSIIPAAIDGQEQHGISVVSGGIIRIQFDGAFELRLCARPVPVIKEFHQSHRRVALGKIGIEFQRLQRRGSRFGHSLTRGHVPEGIRAVEVSVG